MVGVNSLLADEAAYNPVEIEPCTPAYHFEGSKNDPSFLTKLILAALQFTEVSGPTDAQPYRHIAKTK